MTKDLSEAGTSVEVPRDVFDAMIERLQFCLDTFGAIQDRGSEAADLDDWRALIQPTPAETERKPVAWMHPTEGWAHHRRDEVTPHCQKDGPQPVPLYTAPTPPPIGDGEGDLVARLRKLGEWLDFDFGRDDPPAGDIAREGATAIEALRAERDEAKATASHNADVADFHDKLAIKWHAEYRASEAQVSTLSRHLEEAREALRPFAEYMGDRGDLDNLGNPLPDEQGVGWVYLTHGDFRRAKETVSHG